MTGGACARPGDASKGVLMLSAALISLGVVFLAELGDKSQLITMTYALRYRWWVVLSGVGIADEEGPAKTAAEPRFVLLAVVSSFVLAELGDKTMLATVALASDHQWAGVWVGATAGMVVADAVAIAVGRLLHRRLPERFLHIMASLLFLLFGLWI